MANQPQNSTLTLTLHQKPPSFHAGHVWLTGAGPGDPGLLTLHAVHALQQADHIVYDALVDPAILQLASKNAQLEFVGKRGGKPSHKQSDITARLIVLAQEGKKVLRLKGGDPFIFGRGGEEALALRSANIPFRIIPGISAGIAGPALAYIPLTHRDINQSVLFLTGHGANGDVPDGCDWGAIAKAAPVLVLYMAMKHIDAITKRLLENGRAGDEPVAFISHASLPQQRILITTLAQAAQTVEQHAITAPTIIVIGGVVDLRALLANLAGEAS